MITKIEINTGLEHKYKCECCSINIPDLKFKNKKAYLASHCNVTLKDHILLYNVKIYELDSLGVLIDLNTANIFVDPAIVKSKDPNFFDDTMEYFFENKEKYYAEIITEFLRVARDSSVDSYVMHKVNSVNYSDEHRNQN